MITTPTPDEFLAMSEPDEDETPSGFITYSGTIGGAGAIEMQISPPQPDPLASIAASLQTIAAAVGSGAPLVADEQEDTELRQLYDALDQSCADLEDKYEALDGLVDEILAVCKPSVSKLANQVRETVEQWRNPVVEPVEEMTEGKPADPEAAPPPTDAEQPPEPPANDAPIEAWVAYAQGLGLDVDPGRTNRSQIRTLLGLPHYTG